MQINILLHNALESLIQRNNNVLHDFLRQNHNMKINSKRQQCFEKSFKSKICNTFFILSYCLFSLCLHDFLRRNHSVKIDYYRHASLKMHQNMC